MVLFLDSGTGGLVYLEEFRRHRPTVPCEYLADSAWFPYGDRSPEHVRDRVVDLVEAYRMQMRRGYGTDSARPQVINAVVVACNTASVVALSALRSRFSFPVIGVVPAVKPAASVTKTGSIAVLATVRTSTDPYTEDLVRRFARYCDVTRLGLPRAVTAAEHALCEESYRDLFRDVIRTEVAPALKPEIDTIVLACTHFVRHRGIFEEELGPGRTVVDSLDGVVRRLLSVLDKKERVGRHRRADADRPTTFLHTGPLGDHLRCLAEEYRITPFDPAPSPATVIWGANNIYTVRTGHGEVLNHLRIKGKLLAGTEQSEANPLAPGDRVVLSAEEGDRRIQYRLQRENVIQRWNRKRRRRQAIAANVDLVLVVTSVAAPAYRAGFLDRVLVLTELEGITAAIVLNKTDYPVPDEVERHLRILTSLGYPVFRTIAGSARDETVREDRKNRSIPPALRDATEGRVTVLVGRSGVGKSSLINTLVPDASLTVGDVSRKYDRGRHTTTLARQVTASHRSDTIFIDTPGVRDYDLVEYECTEIAAGYREFLPYLPDCRLPGCTHRHEPDCAVRYAVEEGEISRERYGSYLTLAESVLAGGDALRGAR